MTGATISGSVLDNLAGVVGSDASTHRHNPPALRPPRPDPGNDRPPFHNALIHIGEYEWSWWRSLTPAMMTPSPAERMAGSLTGRSSTPSQASPPITHGSRIFPGVRTMMIPGHSTGHTA
ncbi:hypothetical protein [Nocardia tenerifensis]|uniref:hypothetical protein n=1 Tax=Nocardia tenerifensis TaxID=228006 RepID=UPI0003030874|nr:hypothetical protein [Nocardia tenerifensis]